MMEHKQTEAIITTVDEAQGIVEAIWAVMGNVDEVGDIIHPGAFTKTFNERGNQIKLLDNHRTDSVMASLGVVKELREVKQAELPQEMMNQHADVTGGAWGRFQFLLDTPEGKGAFSRIKNGAVKEWSFGYDAVDKDYGQKDGRAVRNLRGIKLYEVSPVLFPANSATTTTGAKAAPDDNEEDEYKATWTASYINDLPDSSFLLVESGGDKDEDGKTTPRSLRHLPYKNAEGDIDLPHLRNAISRLGQEGTGESGGEKWLSEDVRKQLLSRARGLLENANKSDDEPDESKAGRVLSDRNAKRIKAAMAELHNCLMEAGLMEMPADDEHDKPTGPQKSETLPTSNAKEAGPNEEDRTRYLKLIEIQKQALELLEV
jgi:HK97 family phage prohead protease